MWINYFRFGSFVLTLLLFSGCEGMTNSEYITHGEWVYVNESTHVLKLEGAYNHTTEWVGTISFRLQPGESYSIDMKGESCTRDCSSQEIYCPFIRDVGGPLESRIAVDDGEFVGIELGEGVRDRENYRVEKLGRRNFRFTYVFTDDYVRTLVPQLSEKK